jgi:hypothetical protein
MSRLGIFVVLVLGLALAGCSAGTPKRVATPATVAPQKPVGGWSPRERVGKAIELLNAGQREPARRELREVLQHYPADPVARSLYNQLDVDPKAVLGAANFPYRVKPGETMSEIAQRFLGDPLQFYLLARYNGIEAPGGLVGGTTISIPGKARPAPSTHEEPTKRATPTPSAKPATPPPAARPRMPARAAQLRGAALEQMTRGAINRAVALLSQALDLDPDNALVRRDLERALRIRGAVHARP